MEEDTFIWIGVFGFAIAVIALLIALTSGGTIYNFNPEQFTDNSSNISFNTNMSNYNYTIGGHFFYFSSGVCDLTINHSTCTNSSGTMEIG
jgi:hypothetical protein